MSLHVYSVKKKKKKKKDLGEDCSRHCGWSRCGCHGSKWALLTRALVAAASRPVKTCPLFLLMHVMKQDPRPVSVLEAGPIQAGCTLDTVCFLL